MESVEKIWDRYYSGEDSAVGDLIEYYTPFVEKIVNRLASNLPSYVDRDDLMSEGLIGLYDAIGKYETQGYKFETYAAFRIRGEIVDSLRRSDWATRSFRKKNRELDEAADKLTVLLGRTPTDEEVAKELGVTMQEFHDTLSEGVWSSHLYFDEIRPEEGEIFSAWELVEDLSAAESFLEFEDAMDRLGWSVEELTPQEQSVLALYYKKGLSLKEIGEMLDVTESRACQIHTKSLDKIRDTWSAV